MAFNLLSDNQISCYEDAFDSLHMTFGEDVVVVKEANRVVVDTDNEEYNSFYPESSQGNDIEQFEPVSGVFTMRVTWLDPQKQEKTIQQVIRPQIHDNICRLKMKSDALEFIKGYSRFIVQGRVCERVGFSQPHGLVSAGKFFNVFVRETT